MYDRGIQGCQISHEVCALPVGEKVKMGAPVGVREGCERRAIFKQPNFDLPNCFYVRIVEDFVIAGDEINVVTTGDRNDHPIGGIFVKVSWELGAGDRV